MFLRVELIARSWSFFSRKRAQRPMDRKIFALRAPKEFGLRPPGSGDPFSNAHPRHAGGGSRHPVVHREDLEIWRQRSAIATEL